MFLRALLLKTNRFIVISFIRLAIVKEIIKMMVVVEFRMVLNEKGCFNYIII